MFKILIVGSGAREHALAWKLGQDKRVGKIFVAPGNAGTYELERAVNVNLHKTEELLKFAKENEIDLTIVGSEALLVDGIADKFREARLNIFGPEKASAMLEGSKCYSKEFMRKYGVKTAEFASFSDKNAALHYLQNAKMPIVVKASGLAAGKGVIICKNKIEAEQAVISMMEDKTFGSAGEEIVIEQYLEGFEVSILSFCDGKTILPMISAKDHKTIGEYNTGANTGGMGVVAPHPSMTEEQYQLFLRDICEPTLRGIQEEKMRYCGVIFFGLMVCSDGVYLLEYNCRFGDPETQAVLMLLETPLLTPIFACFDHKLHEIKLEWSSGVAVCLVAASAGYPGKYEVGFPVYHIEKAKFFTQIFIAGATYNSDIIETSGGRVLNVVAKADDLPTARKIAYESMNIIEFEGKTFRNDIGEI